MRKSAGFTLIELLVTMTVAGILVALAGPSFKTTIQNNRLITQANDLLGTLIYARSEAIELNSTVTVCASTDGATCNASNWATGWVVGYNPSGGSNAVATVLRVHPAISGSNTLTSNFGGSSVTTLGFLSSGLFNGANPGYMSVCDSRGTSYGRSLYLMVSGQARLSTTAGKQINGSNMSC